MNKITYNLDKSFRANDIRGVYNKDLDEEMYYKTARAFSSHFRLKSKTVIVGRDVRISSPNLSKSFIKGLLDSGTNVIDIGIMSTPSVYFASGKYKKYSAMITASHNPKEDNGLKLTKPGAIPIGGTTGLNELKKIVEKNKFPKIEIKKGKILKKNIMEEYVRYVHSFVNIKKIKKMKIFVDTGNGIEGKIVPQVFKKLPIKIVPLYFKLSGLFPNHPANPADPKNLKMIRKRMKKSKDERFGIAFDADGDRVFFIDEKGNQVSSAITGALIMKYLFKKNPKAKSVCSLVSSQVIFDTAKSMGVKILKGKVGHSYIKRRMRATKAIFGCEHSGHFYYRDNFYADSGIITALIMCEILSENPSPFSSIVNQFQKYYKMREGSVGVENKKLIMKKVEIYYKNQKQKPLHIQHLDGVTIQFKNFWLNVRPSNTESVIRLNLEANTLDIMRKREKELYKLISKYKKIK